MNKEKTYSLFPQNFTKLTEESESIESIKKIESSVFHSFSARRNASRIDHYFVNLHSFRFRLFTYLVTAILFLFIIVSTFIFTNQIYLNYLRKNTMAMMNAIHNNISIQIRSSLFELQMSTIIISNLLKPLNLLTSDGENAKIISQIFYKADLASSENIGYWNLGLPTGELIAIETGQAFPILKYADTAPDKIGFLKYWPADSHFYNDSFPFQNGIPIIQFNSTSTEWYQIASKIKRQAWTDIYEADGYNEKILSISTACPLLNNVQNSLASSISAVVSNAVSLDISQKLLNSLQPSNNSRIAITTSTATVLGMTGDDKMPTDEFTDTIVTKQLEEVEDYIWHCFTADSNYMDNESDSFTCMINQKEVPFYLSKEIIQLSPDMHWILWSIFCLDDFVGNKDMVFQNIFIYPLGIIISVWIFLILGSLLLAAYIESMHNRILSQESLRKKNDKQIKSIGIIYALQELNNIKLVHSDNQVITSEIDNVINELQSLDNDLLYNRENVYQTIKNPEVRKSIISLYGVTPSQIRYKAMLSNQPQEVIGPARVQYENQGDESLSSIASNIESPNKPSNNNLHAEFEIQFEPCCRQCPLQIADHLLKNRVVMIFRQCNEKGRMFLNEDFCIFIEALFSEIGEPVNKFAADSIYFLHILCKKFGNQPDFEMPLLFASLIWHVYMKDRNKDGIDRIRRYFIINSDEKEFKAMAEDFLLQLFPKRIDSEPQSSQQWESFSLLVMSLIETAAISHHYTVISQFALTSKWINETDGLTLTIQQTIAFMRLLYNFSMVSFFFHPEQFRIAFSQLLNPDYESDADNIRSFSHSIFIELIDRTVSVLKCIWKPYFFLSMRRD